MKDKHLLAILPIALISMCVVSSCNKREEVYAHMNTTYYHEDYDNSEVIEARWNEPMELTFHNHGGKGYIEAFCDKRNISVSGYVYITCEYSGNNVYCDTELVGTFINYYTFTMDNVNYFVTNFD